MTLDEEIDAIIARAEEEARQLIEETRQRTAVIVEKARKEAEAARLRAAGFAPSPQETVH
jgi:vacuolar-type H+-ATPase subunit H